MDKEVLIHQALHGYKSGHQLLAASGEFSISERGLMDTMSDGAGINAVNCPDGYLTGYALPESKKYVLAKTWYADDKERSGCVWTHSLIFDITDISYMRFTREILQLFHKPEKEVLDEYKEPITLFEMKTPVSLDKLQYVLYTIYASNKSRYVEITDNSYDESVLLAISYMPQTLLLQFSFCSESLVNRYIFGKVFSYQLVKREFLYRVYSEDQGRLFTQRNNNVTTSPAWAREYGRIIADDKVDNINLFCDILSEYLQTFQAFNQLLRLYFITDKINGQYSLFKYFEILEKLSEEKDGFLEECVLWALVDSDYFDSMFSEHFMELINIAEKNNKKLKKADKEKIVNKILNKHVEKIPEFLENYIHGELSKQAASIAQMIILQAKPKHLKQISNMEHDIVVVAVAMNNELILSENIFKRSKDYQCDVINVLSSELAMDVWTRILSLILRVSEEDISEVVYNKLGERLVPLLLELFQKELPEQNESCYIWDRYLLKNQKCLIQNLPKFTKENLRKHFLFKINTYDEEVRNAIPTEEWIKLFRTCCCDNEEEKREIAIKMFPLILNDGKQFSIGIVSYVFGILHRALADSQIAYEKWSELEKQLPEVDICFAWDKCLRLRKAFEKRGYDIEMLFREYENINV